MQEAGFRMLIYLIITTGQCLFLIKKNSSDLVLRHASSLAVTQPTSRPHASCRAQNVGAAQHVLHKILTAVS